MTTESVVTLHEENPNTSVEQLGEISGLGLMRVRRILTEHYQKRLKKKPWSRAEQKAAYLAERQAYELTKLRECERAHIIIESIATADI